MKDAETTATVQLSKKRRVVGRPFVKGQSGNPLGRPKGSRHRLQDSFLSDLSDAWALRGPQALEECARSDPAAFVKIVASLMPKDVNLNATFNADAFADSFSAAVARLHEQPQRRLKLINGNGD